MNRRSFLQACIAASAAPAIVRASSIMRIVPRVWAPPGLAYIVREICGEIGIPAHDVDVSALETGPEIFGLESVNRIWDGGRLIWRREGGVLVPVSDVRIVRPA